MARISCSLAVLPLVFCATLTSCDDIIATHTDVAYMEGLGGDRTGTVSVPRMTFPPWSFAVVVRPVLDCGQVLQAAAQVSINGAIVDITPTVFIPRHQRGASFTCDTQTPDSAVAYVQVFSNAPVRVRVHGRRMSDNRSIVIEDTVQVIPLPKWPPM